MIVVSERHRERLQGEARHDDEQLAKANRRSLEEETANGLSKVNSTVLMIVVSECEDGESMSISEIKEANEFFECLYCVLEIHEIEGALYELELRELMEFDWDSRGHAPTALGREVASFLS